VGAGDETYGAEGGPEGGDEESCELHVVFWVVVGVNEEM
jgi:hypothetical protein